MTPTSFPAALRAVALAASGLALAGGASAAGRAPSSLIPRAILFGNPERANPQISPDGSRIAYLAPRDGVMNLWVAPAGDIAAAKPVTKDRGRGIQTYFWAYNNRHLLYLQDSDGDENWHVYRLDLATDAVTDLTPIKGVSAQVQEVSHRHPDAILVGLNDRNPQLHDIYRIDLGTGERTLVFRNEGYIAVGTDDDLRVRTATAFQPDFRMRIDRVGPENKIEPFLTIPAEDTTTTGALGFDKTGRFVYLLDSRGRDKTALTRVGIDNGASETLAEGKDADISALLGHPTEKTILAVAENYTRTRWRVLDDSVRADFDALAKVSDGDFSVVSQTLDNQTWLVAYTEDDGPIRYYRYDRPTKKAALLLTSRPALESLPLAKLHPVVLKARDGLDLVAYLTLPVGSDGDNNARPDKPLPLILLVHGGPWSRDQWGFNAFHQWLANRGYAVLSVNFRGSTGLGKRFINAANREWGGKMHEDLLDAVDWAIREKIADPRRVAISGGSYGGYATLVGMTFTPEKFACGVDIVGPSNLMTWMKNIPPYWMPFLPFIKDRVGDPESEEGSKFLAERSPLSKVGDIKRPLLIAQGANDPRVVQTESEQIVRAMREKNIPVTYVLYSDEGHGFVRPENRLSFFAVMEAFLSEHLGGPFEPVGDDFRGSSIEVREGGEHIKGLAAALAAKPKEK